MNSDTASNAERFLNAYASVERSLNRILKRTDYVPFTTLIRIGAKQNPVVRNHLESLKEYAELRNAIVHQRGSHMEVIAEPDDSVTKDFERIAFLLNQDLNVMHFASSPVRTADVHDTLREAFEKMQSTNQHYCDKMPVYDAHVFAGLLTMEDIARAMLEGKTAETQISEILHHAENERAVFLAETAEISEVIQAFEAALKNGNKAPVILISEHGQTDEKPLGIISSSDLPSLLAILA